jgi:hypothetical protein
VLLLVLVQVPMKPLGWVCCKTGHIVVSCFSAAVCWPRSG